jgi:hypothetical protein
MSIGAIGGPPAHTVLPAAVTHSNTEKSETGPDHDGDGDDTGTAAAAPSASAGSGQGQLVNLLA